MQIRNFYIVFYQDPDEDDQYHIDIIDVDTGNTITKSYTSEIPADQGDLQQLEDTVLIAPHNKMLNLIDGEWYLNDFTSTTPLIDLQIGFSVSDPENLTTSFISSGGFFANWDQVEGADYYEMEVLDDGDNVIQEHKPNNSNSSVVGLDSATEYKWRVRAVIDPPGQDPNFSDWVEADSFYTLLGIPTNLTNTNITATSFTANWDTVDDADEYVLRVEDTSGNEVHSTTTSSTSQNVTGLEAETEYNWFVRAKSDDDNIPDSEEANTTVTTDDAEIDDLSCEEVDGEVAVEFFWSSVGPDATYDIERSDDGGVNWTQIESGVSFTAYKDDDDNLNNNTDYTYRVRAVINSNEHSWSNEVTCNTGEEGSPDNPPDDEPENLQISIQQPPADCDGLLEFQWDNTDLVSDIDIEVQMKDDQGDWQDYWEEYHDDNPQFIEESNNGTQTQTYTFGDSTINGLEEEVCGGEEFRFRARYTNAEGSGDWSPWSAGQTT